MVVEAVEATSAEASTTEALTAEATSEATTEEALQPLEALVASSTLTCELHLPKFAINDD